MKFTSEQHAAISTHDRNLIVTAGAGSGKTRVLVERFIHLLDANPTWTLPSVVAITFTEKAAREMRDRVDQALARRIRDAIADDEADALRRWLDCEADLTRARIGTIHSLCAQVLRANPAEAAIDPGFRVLDENDAAMLRDEAVEATLAALGAEDRPGSALLIAYDLRQVRAVLDSFAGQGAAEAVAALDLTPESLLARWKDLWEIAGQDLIEALRTDSTLWSALNWIAPADLPDNDLRADVWRAVFAHVLQLVESDDPAVVLEALRQIDSAIKLTGGKADNWGGKERLDESKAMLRTIRDTAQALIGATLPPLETRDDEAARWLGAWADAIQLTAVIYAGMKHERGALDFDDLEARACALLCENPTVAARYRDEFRHILVDEFQDTNDAQRSIVYALAGVGEGCGDAEFDASGRLFVVGDPKQSIYAFRGADVSVFGQVRDDITGAGGAELPLSMSFRTQSRLVDAFNDVFERILQPESGPAARYAVALDMPMQAFRPAEDFHDCPLTVFAFPKPEQEPESGSVSDAIREWEAITLAEHIRDMVGRQTPVFDRDKNTYRPLAYGDVAILFQSMARVPRYEDAFKAYDLPYVTVAGKGYYDRQEVWDLLNLLGALYNPADDLALAAVLRSPVFGLSDDALLALRIQPGGRSRHLLWDVLYNDDLPDFPEPDIPARDFARSVLHDLRDIAGRVTVAELLTRALDRTGTLATLTGLADGARRRGNVEKLIALARQSGRVALGDFLAYARELAAREVREGEAVIEVADAVTLMSVHASKGLEFPVVVLADASWTRNRRDGSPFVLDPDIGAACTLPVEDDPDDKPPDPFAYALAGQLAERRDRAERKRLLYVGATRAQDYLIVSGSLYRCADQAWLRQWLDALGVGDDELVPDDAPLIRDYTWGQAAIHVPYTVRELDVQPFAAPATQSGWDDPAVVARVPFPGVVPDLPPLLDPVPVAPDAPARSLSATQLGVLGRVPFYDPAQSGRDHFRHAVLHDAPDPVRALPEREPPAWRLRRIVGQMVHRALQVWALPDIVADEDLRARLHAYAWDESLSDPDLVMLAIEQALDLLHTFAGSALRLRLDAAEVVYRELPFMLRYGGRTLHGVIDVLYRDARGWHVLDYKTAPVSGRTAEDNARRYYLQVGIYARAVEAQTGQLPAAALYYVHPGWLVTVAPEQWSPVLDRLEDELHAALGG